MGGQVVVIPACILLLNERNIFLKMRPLLYLVAVAYILLLVGCANTEGTLDFEGFVLDEYTKEGAPNRIVIIQGMIYGESGLIPTKDIGRFNTDSCGHFTYKLKKTKGAYWYNFVFVGDTAYSYSAQSISLDELTRNSKYLSFYLDRFTDFAIKVERRKKNAPYDTLFISWKTNDIDGRIYPHRVINYGIVPDLEYRWIGGNVKSMIETKAFANKNTIVHMVIFSTGGVREMSDTIYCERNVKNNFTFKY